MFYYSCFYIRKHFVQKSVLTVIRVLTPKIYRESYPFVTEKSLAPFLYTMVG